LRLIALAATMTAAARTPSPAPKPYEVWAERGKGVLFAREILVSARRIARTNSTMLVARSVRARTETG
jgi:hypothetical protein